MIPEEISQKAFHKCCSSQYGWKRDKEEIRQEKREK
jgi:hypothetical protein